MSSINLTIGGRSPRHSASGDVKPAVAANLTGIWLFNRRPGASDAEALAAGRRNRMPGASNGPDDNIFPFDLPTVHDDYWSFSPTSPLLTRVPHTENMTIMVFCRTLANITSSQAYVAGTFGNTLNGGAGIEYNSTANMRMVAYEDTNPDELEVNQIVNGTGTHNRWRLFRGRLNDVNFGLKNLTGDGVSNEVTQTPLPSGNAIGLQSLSIGGRIGATTPLLHGVDIAAVVTTSGNWSGGDEDLMAAQVRRQIGLTGLTEGVA